MTTLPALDADHHALTVDVGDLQLQKLASAQARAIERHEQYAVIEVLRAGNEPTHFLGTQNGGQPAAALGCGELLFQLTTLEDADKDEAERRHVQADGPNRQFPLLEEIRLVAAQGIPPELLKPAASVVALAGAKRVQVGANRGRGIVAPDQFVVHPLEQCRHRSYLL